MGCCFAFFWRQDDGDHCAFAEMSTQVASVVVVDGGMASGEEGVTSSMNRGWVERGLRRFNWSGWKQTHDDTFCSGTEHAIAKQDSYVYIYILFPTWTNTLQFLMYITRRRSIQLTSFSCHSVGMRCASYKHVKPMSLHSRLRSRTSREH